MSKSENRSTCWSLTINNPTAQDEECIALARQKGWKVEGQKERGVEGTEHYQLMVKTPQVRFSAMKKAFPRGHIEVARNPSALSQYVAKEESRVADLPMSQERYPSLVKFWELIVGWLDDYNALHLNYVLNPRNERPDSIWWKDAKQSWKRDSLSALDDATAFLIEQGYMVETHACNPQVRMAWKKFHASIIIRSYADKYRQTDNCVSFVEDSVEAVNIPNADDTTHPQTPEGLLG